MVDIDLGGARVLVVDDSRTIQHHAQTLLASAGCEVSLADNGFDALSKIESHSPDIIFVDALMPRLDGYQLCAMIKKCARYREMAVVMLSGKDNLFDRARGLMAGADAYVTKPFTLEGLSKAVKEQLGAQRSKPAGQDRRLRPKLT